MKGVMAGLIVIVTVVFASLIGITFVENVFVNLNIEKAIDFLDDFGYWVLAGGSHTVPGDLLPSKDSTYDVGASGTEWAEGHFDNVYGTSSVRVGSRVLTDDGTLLEVDGKDIALREDLGALGATAWVVASDAPADIKTFASLLQNAGYSVWVCDGIDDQVEIQAAIDALSSAASKTEPSGGLVGLTYGKYYISSPISISTWGVHLKGAGNKATLLYLVNNADCNVIEIGVTGTPILPTISDLNIYANKDNNAGTVHGIYMHYAGNPRIERVWIDDADIGIGSSGSSGMSIWDISILASTIENCGTGIRLEGYNASYGIGGAYISHNYIVNNTIGLEIYSYYTRGVEVVGNDIHGCTEEAIKVGNGSTGAYDVTIVANRIETTNTAAKNCIEIDGTGTAVEYLKISNNYISGGKYGIHLSGSWNHSSVDDNVFRGSGTSSLSININSNQRGTISRNIDQAGITAYTDHWKYSNVSVTIGLNDSYGTAVNLYSNSHTIRTAHIKITISGVVAGETVTCKVEALRKDGTTSSVTWTPGVGVNGSHWLDEDDWLSLWTSNVAIYRFNISAKTDQASTAASVTVDAYGTG